MKTSKILLVFTLLLSNLVCFADTGFDDDVQDVPNTPINQWVYLVMIAAIYFGYKSIMHTAKKVKSKEA